MIATEGRLQPFLQALEEAVHAAAVHAQVAFAYATRAADVEGALTTGFSFWHDDDIDVIFEKEGDPEDGAHAAIRRLHVHLHRPHVSEYGLHGAKQHARVDGERASPPFAVRRVGTNGERVLRR